MKRTAKKITLNRETLHQLEAARMADVAGGLSHMPCPTIVPSCVQTSCQHFTRCLCH